MRTIDGVKFADSLDELTPQERSQIDRIVADVTQDYMARVPVDHLETADGLRSAEDWAHACATLQAIDSINTQRYVRVRGVPAMTQLQQSGRFAKELLVETRLPKAPWE